MKRFVAAGAFVALCFMHTIVLADCVSDCTTRYVYACGGTVFDPIRECEEEVTDPLCVARCTAEREIRFNGCDVARTSPDYQRGVAILRESRMSRNACHSIVDGGSQVASAYGLYESYRTLRSVWDFVSTTTLIGIAVSEGAKVAGHCSCNDALPQ